MSSPNLEDSHSEISSFTPAVLILSILLFVSLVCIAFFAHAGKAGVWTIHAASGRALLAGETPLIPAYPMWGYSLLAGIFKNFILIPQIILLLITLFYFKGKFNNCTRESEINQIVIDFIRSPLGLVILFFPWIFLLSSYFDSSMSSLFAVISIFILVTAVENIDDSFSIKPFILSGISLGIAYNIRSEFWILAVMISISLLIYAFRSNTFKVMIKPAALFIIVFTIFTIPWLIYTGNTTGKPNIGSSNAGGVAYLGLGYLPNNPWGIFASDYYVADIAMGELGEHPYSQPANELFTGKYFEAIKQHPFAYCMRILYGFKLVLMQGFYVPEMENLWSFNDRNKILYDLAGENIKGILGYSVNPYQVEAYKKMGISSEEIGFKHYAALGFEIFLRALSILLLIVLLIFAGITIYKRGMFDFVSLICIACIITAVLPQVLIQAHPKHTTMLIPILIYTGFLTTKYKRIDYDS